jgi:hypothetical protein
MKHLLITVLLFTASFTAVAQTTTYDIFSYTVPKGFLLRPNENFLMYEKNEGKEYCQLFIYPATTGAKNGEADFKKAWDFFARNAQQQVSDPETKETDTSAAWHNYFGAARGTFNKKMFVVSVSSFTMKDITFYAAAVFTKQDYLPTAQAFIESIKPDASKFVRKNNTPSNNNTTSGVSSNNTSSSKTASLVANPSTTFSDGWTSTYVGPYVTVAKDNVQAWIFPVNDSLEKTNRKPEEYLEDKYWRYAVNQFFQVRNVVQRPWQMSGPGTDKIFEAEVKNRQTGQESFVAMRVIWNSGRAQPVLAFAATKEQLYNSVFAQYNSFEQVLPYNKFMPTPAALQGTWQRVETGATESYTIGGGFQGGMKKISSKDIFIFSGDGSYESSHVTNYNAATGAGPKPQIHKGRFTINGTTILLTNRRADETGDYECWMEAVDGGLALKLINKKSPGLRYMLLRVR